MGPPPWGPREGAGGSLAGLEAPEAYLSPTSRPGASAGFGSGFGFGFRLGLSFRLDFGLDFGLILGLILVRFWFGLIRF